MITAHLSLNRRIFKAQQPTLHAHTVHGQDRPAVAGRLLGSGFASEAPGLVSEQLISG